MSKLKQIKIEAPEDFTADVDLYVSGGKGCQISYLLMLKKSLSTKIQLQAVIFPKPQCSNQKTLKVK